MPGNVGATPKSETTSTAGRLDRRAWAARRLEGPAPKARRSTCSAAIRGKFLIPIVFPPFTLGEPFPVIEGGAECSAFLPEPSARAILSLANV